MIKKYFAVAVLLSVPVFAQHEHQMPMPAPKPQTQPQHEHMQMPMQKQADLAQDFLMQQASGTSLNPAAAATHMKMSMTTFDKWMLMFHGQAFLNQVVQTGSRGADGFFPRIGSWGWRSARWQAGI